MGDLIITLLILIAAVPAIAFPFVYGFTAKWYKTPLGNAFMLNAASIGLIMGLVAFTVLHGPDYPGREYVRFVVYGLISTMLWVQLISYISAVRSERRKRKEGTNVP